MTDKNIYLSDEEWEHRKNMIMCEDEIVKIVKREMKFQKIRDGVGKPPSGIALSPFGMVVMWIYLGILELYESHKKVNKTDYPSKD